jgi:hypothetical protein
MTIMPLGDAEYNLAKDTVQMGPEILEYLRKCEACGLPIGSRKDAVDTACQFCQAVLDNFFPDRA